MAEDQWQSAKQALEVMSSLEGVARRNYLKHLKRTSPKLAKEVKELLAAASAAEEDSFLGMPAAHAEPFDVEDVDPS
ncbi:MAG: hypothetical protein KDA57_10315 [Planctomycetales bacterium]|nr:hypothetical protein [Planctomycetales bacterium]